MADQVEIFLLLREARKFIEDANRSAQAVSKIGKASEKTGKQAGIGWKGVAKWAGGAALFYGATRYLEGAVNSSTALAKATLGVQAATSLDTKTASEWIGVLAERNISVQRFSVGLKTLNKQIEASRLGTGKQTAEQARLVAQMDAVRKAGGSSAPAALTKLSTALLKTQAAGAASRKTLEGLGVSQEAIARGDTEEVLLQIADGMKNLRNHTARSVAAQTLFGRSGVALLPVLARGREGVEELLAVQERYGNFLSGKNMHDTQAYIERQRALDTAMAGFKLQLGEALMPALIQVSNGLLFVANVLRPLTKHTWLMVTALGALAVAFIAYIALLVVYTYATAAAAVATNALFLPLWAIIGLVILAVALWVALIVLVVVLYRRWGFFHKVVNGTVKTTWRLLQFLFHWVIRNWPYLVAALVGPFALAGVFIYRHFDQIKRFLLGLVREVKRAILNLVHWATSLPDKLGKTLRKIPGMGVALKVGGVLAGVGARAEGGPIGHTGRYLVGERGPEIVSLPRGAYVTSNAAMAATSGGGGQARPIELTVPLVVDGRELARAVARVSANRQARR